MKNFRALFKMVKPLNFLSKTINKEETWINFVRKLK